VQAGSAAPKNPVKAAAGRMGAARRWAGRPRTRVRIDDLTPRQAALVLELVAQSRDANKKAAADSDPATAKPGGHARDPQAG
jgi:hypothetical protein